MADFVVKQNDTLPVLAITLKEGDPSAPTAVNLSTATSVKLLMRPVGGGSVITRTAAITSAAAGQITVTFQAADTGTSGDYEGEIEVTWTGGGIETFPHDSYIAIRIVDDIG